MEPIIEQALRQMLLSLPAVSGLVAQRIRPDMLDRSDVLPAIRFEIENEEVQNDLDGRGGLIIATAMIDCMSDSRLGSRQLEQAVRTNNTNPGTGLQAYRGQVGNLFIGSASLMKRQPYFLERQTEEDRDWYGIGCTYQIHYQEIA